MAGQRGAHQLSADPVGGDSGEALGLTAQVVEPISADRVCGYMQQVLEQLAEALEHAPNRPVRNLDILPAAERSYLLEDLNRTAADYPSERCIHELFEQQVRRAPEAVALVHEDEELSYGELNARANRLAHHLIALGVRPDQPVAICLERSPAMVVGLLAILKAGGAYLPLDPAYPSARLRQIVEDAAPRRLLCDAAGRAALGPEALVDLTVVDLETATPAWADQSADDPDPRALGLSPRHLAYVIYTSGSTGTPKGVMVEHQHREPAALEQRRICGIRDQPHAVFLPRSVLICPSMSASLRCRQGGTLYLVEDAPGAGSAPWMSLDHTVPSAIAALVDKQAVPASTRVINLAGERLKADLIERVFESSGLCKSVRSFETTTYSTWICMPRGEAVVETIGPSDRQHADLPSGRSWSAGAVRGGG
ncbi:AMP-binding protein [Neorhizobium galegae]|uniref:AMP-binding protein n=1 Tax=Neorhizobium galegae TaxID=399 RepID=A0A6A1TIX8_NEOGA|nr:AMP-binding protein [Neorhizobium galegae]KAB1082431.1 AMP-binding protein [Neorhizobium galegae]